MGPPSISSTTKPATRSCRDSEGRTASSQTLKVIQDHPLQHWRPRWPATGGRRPSPHQLMINKCRPFLLSVSPRGQDRPCPHGHGTTCCRSHTYLHATVPHLPCHRRPHRHGDAPKGHHNVMDAGAQGHTKRPRHLHGPSGVQDCVLSNQTVIRQRSNPAGSTSPHLTLGVWVPVV